VAVFLDDVEFPIVLVEWEPVHLERVCGDDEELWLSSAAGEHEPFGGVPESLVDPEEPAIRIADVGAEVEALLGDRHERLPLMVWLAWPSTGGCGDPG